MKTQVFSQRGSPTDLDNSFLMHGDDVVGLFGQLVQGHGCVKEEQIVVRLQVLNQRANGSMFTKACPIGAPHAAVADGLGQVAAKSDITLQRGEQEEILDQQHPLDQLIFEEKHQLNFNLTVNQTESQYSDSKSRFVVSSDMFLLCYSAWPAGGQPHDQRGRPGFPCLWLVWR